MHRVLPFLQKSSFKNKLLLGQQCRQCKKAARVGPRPERHFHQKLAFLGESVQPVSTITCHLHHVICYPPLGNHYFRFNLKNKACPSAISNSAQSWVFWRDIQGASHPCTLPYSVLCWGGASGGSPGPAPGIPRGPAERFQLLLPAHLGCGHRECSSAASSPYPRQGKRGSVALQTAMQQHL